MNFFVMNTNVPVFPRPRLSTSDEQVRAHTGTACFALVRGSAIGLVWGCLLVAVFGCEKVGPPSSAGAGPGHREQSLALTPQQELVLGRQAFREVLNDPEHFGRPLPDDSPEAEQVRQVTRRIIDAAGIEPLQREINLRKGYRFDWEVKVLKNPQINAFCLPGGKVGVFTGILHVTENQDQLATVLSHEIAHALAHHTSERIARGGMQPGGGGLWAKAFDRREESEADHIGIFLMTFAGYKPDESVRFWQHMQDATGGRGRLPEILSDHPSDEHRIHDLKAWISHAVAAKRAYDEGHIAPPR
jgi:predicted Zn-dependent protease